MAVTTPLESAARLYRSKARLTAAGVLAAREARSRPDRLFEVVVAFQVAAIQLETGGTVDMLEEQGIPLAAEGVLVPAMLAGVASDGRGLGSLLTIPDLTANQFDRIVATQLQDVARHAASIERGVRPQVDSYVRVVNLPACGRCIILAGTPSASEEPFERHPRCDCTAAPSTRRLAEGLAASPAEAFEQMSVAEREKAFTKAGAEAIRLGADPAQVVNARRGMTTAQGVGESTQTRVRRRRTGEERLSARTAYGSRGRLVRDEDGLYTTREGVARAKSGRTRGLAAQSMQRAGIDGPRLMPESIAEIATDPADHIRLLRAYGYIR